jgi:hypothetical protein
MDGKEATATTQERRRWVPAALTTVAAVALVALACFVFFYHYIVDVFEKVVMTLLRLFFGWG